MKDSFTPLVRNVLILCLLLLGLYNLSDYFHRVPPIVFYTSVAVLLVVGTIAARVYERRKAEKTRSESN